MERLFLLLNVSNRKRLQVYIHKRNYPTELIDEHEFAVGDIPEHVIKRMFQMYYMKEMYQDANPFQYVPALDRVIYYPHFRHTNPALFDPDNKEKLDAARICRLTSWTPTSGVELDWVTGEDIETEAPDRIDLLFEAGLWVFRKPHVYIGVYNSKPEDGPLEFTINMREMTQQSLLPDELKAKLDIYEKVHEGTDAHEASNQERSEKNL